MSHEPHGHAHHHHGDGTRGALLWALGLNGGFLLVEAGVGWWTGSLALLSDAGHMLSDVGALLLALGALWLAQRERTPEATFGFRRAEVVGGFLNALTLLVVCGVIVREAVVRLAGTPPEMPGGPVMVVGVVGLLINLGSAYFLYRSGSENLNVQGALAHMLADALGSLGAVVAAALLMAGVPAADPLISLFTAALILWGTVGLLRTSARVLLQLPPRGFDVEGMEGALAGHESVRSLHAAHVWTLDGVEPIVSVHLVVRSGADFDEVQSGVVALLRERFGAKQTTVQLEREGSKVCGGVHGH